MQHDQSETGGKFQVQVYTKEKKRMKMEIILKSCKTAKVVMIAS